MAEDTTKQDLMAKMDRLKEIQVRRSEISSEDCRLKNEDNTLSSEQDRLRKEIGEMLVRFDRDLVWVIGQSHPAYRDGAKASA